MGVFDKIKDIISSKIGDVPTIKATMLGPRAVGKTSVMASIFSDSRDEIAGTKLYFRPQKDTASVLISKKLQLMDIIGKRTSVADKPNTGAIEASNTATSFDFEMGILGRDKSVNISITDFPGEYLNSQTQIVSDFIAESHIVMIAIDTPYLMEEDGKYNDEKNDVSTVISFINKHSESIKDKMILLVPLKCERYFHDDRISEVKSRVRIVYDELISFCGNNNIACVITPIQTLGGVEFDKFVDNNNSFSSLTKLSTYRFYGENPKYTPMFCVQPLYYLLTYVANCYEWGNAQNTGFFSKLKGSLLSMLKDDVDFFHEIKKLSSKVITDKNGYCIAKFNTILNLK